MPSAAPPTVTAPPNTIDKDKILEEKRFIEATLTARTYNKEERDAALVKLTQLNDLINSDDALREQEYQDDFNAWLRGKGKHADHCRTPWQRTPLVTLPGVADYLERGYKEKWKLMTEMAVMELRKVTDLRSAERYFKYIIRGKQNGLYHNLNRYSVMQQDDRDRLALGDGLVDRINSATVGQRVENKYKQVANDFRDYLEYEATLDADERMLFRSKLQRKDSLITKLSVQVDEGDAGRLIEEYEKRTADYASLYSGATKALAVLNARQKAIFENERRLIRAGKYNGRIREALEAEYRTVETQIQKAQDRQQKWRLKVEEELKEDDEYQVKKALESGELISNDYLYQNTISAWRDLIKVTRKLLRIIHTYLLKDITAAEFHVLPQLYSLLYRICLRLRVLATSEFEDTDYQLIEWESSMKEELYRDVRTLIYAFSQLASIIKENEEALYMFEDKLLRRMGSACFDAVTILKRWSDGKS